MAAAAVVGFVGNEAVAVFRIRVGRQIGSAALVADGYHARTDGWTSLAVLFGAVGLWLWFPLADPIVGLLIAAAILVIVWQSGKSVFTRLLDGVEPVTTEEIATVVRLTAKASASTRSAGRRDPTGMTPSPMPERMDSANRAYKGPSP